MKTLRLIVALSGLALLAPAAFAQSIDDLKEMSPEERREYVQGLSDEQRQALKAEQKARWDSMSDEERKAARREMNERRQLNRDAMRQKWDSMSDEEREAARAKRQAQREQHRETWNNMSDEEKAAARSQMRERRDHMGGQRHKKRDRKPRQQ